MNCERTDRLISGKAGDGSLPLGARFHLLRCPSCAAAAAKMDAALRSLREDALPSAPDFSDPIMRAIRLLPRPEVDPVSFRDWAIGGAVIFAALGIAPLNASFKWVKTAFGSDFMLPLNIVMGLLIAGYCALFIGTHLKQLTEKANLRHD